MPSEENPDINKQPGNKKTQKKGTLRISNIQLVLKILKSMINNYKIIKEDIPLL